MEGHRTAERRSLAYHRAIAERLPTEPEILRRANACVQSWVETGSIKSAYVTAWRHILARPPAEIATAIADASERMTMLRQVSPFAGALDPRTRWAIWRSVA